MAVPTDVAAASSAASSPTRRTSSGGSCTSKRDPNRPQVEDEFVEGVRPGAQDAGPSVDVLQRSHGGRDHGGGPLHRHPQDARAR